MTATNSAPDPSPEMSPEYIRGARYASIRKALAGSPPKDNTTYLLAQIALILCDVLDAVERQEAYLHEMAVHGVQVKK